MALVPAYLQSSYFDQVTFSVGILVGIVCIFLILGDGDKFTDVFGRADPTPWCWIKNEKYQLWADYIFLMVCAGLSVLALTATLCSVWHECCFGLREHDQVARRALGRVFGYPLVTTAGVFLGLMGRFWKQLTDDTEVPEVVILLQCLLYPLQGSNLLVFAIVSFINRLSYLSINLISYELFLKMHRNA